MSGEEEEATELGRHAQAEVQAGSCGSISHSSSQGGPTSSSPTARAGGNILRSQGKLAGDKRTLSFSLAEFYGQENNLNV